MGRSPDKSTIIKGNQVIVTIPKPITEAMNIENKQKVQWRVKGKKTLELELL